MIFDRTLMFSKDQQINGAHTNSTNVVDLGPVPNGLKRDIGKGNAIPILVQVTETFTGAGTVQVICETSDNENMSSPTTIWVTPAVPATQLKAGYVFTPEQLQRGTNKRYMQLRYVAGTDVSGKITAGITMGNQSNE